MLELPTRRSLCWLTLLLISSTSAFQSQSTTTSRLRKRTNAAIVMRYSSSGNDTNEDTNQESRRRKLKSKLSSFMSETTKKRPAMQEKTEDEKRIDEYLEYIQSRENRLKNARRQRSRKKKPNDFFVTKPKDYMAAAFKKPSKKEQTDYSSQYLQYIGHRYDRLRTDDYSFIESQWYNSRGPTKHEVKPSNQELISTDNSLENSVKKDANKSGLFGRSSKMRSLLCKMKRKDSSDKAVKKTRLQILKRSSKIAIGIVTTALFLRMAVTATFVMGLRLGVILA